MEDNKKYGTLLNSNIKLHRQWFREAVQMLGIWVLYRAPLPDKHWTNYTEIDANYAPPIKVGCFFHEHPDQKTLKKIGWVTELQDGASLIEVDYDLPQLQQGALFIVPGGLDNSKGRLFRVSSLTNSMVYPASITCEIVPEYEDTINQVAMNDFKASDFNLISEEDETNQLMGYNEAYRYHIGEDEDDLWN